MTVSVRYARPDDRPFITLLGESSSAETTSPHRPAPAHATALAFRKLLAYCAERSANVTLIGEVDGERAGISIIVFDLLDDVTQREQAFIAYMAVTREHRRRGVARALLAAAEEEARRRGLSHISLMVTEASAPARALYAQAGFTDERVLMTKAIGRAAR
jgi:ribosomal protein S18 acetylase RimI-like enzyme